MIDDAAFQQQVQATRALIDRRLADLADQASGTPVRLAEAVRHGVTSRGKRFRPLLTLLACRQFGGDEQAALNPACAVELVHAASLVLDDLPAMDDAGLRRSRPTLHRLYGEDAAILTAIGLLNQAFAVCADSPTLDVQARLDLIGRLSGAVGYGGLVAGQARDLFEREQQRDAAALERLNHEKTGVLIACAAWSGARVAGADAAGLAACDEFGRRLGLAFQIQDDLLDGDGPDRTGKDGDQDAGHVTLASLMGRGRAAEMMDAHMQAALDALPRGPDGQPGPLARFANTLFIRHRAAA